MVSYVSQMLKSKEMNSYEKTHKERMLSLYAEVKEQQVLFL